MISLISLWCLLLVITLFLEWVSVLVVSITTSNGSILLNQIFLSFPLSVFYRPSAEHPHGKIHQFNIKLICLSRPACPHIHIQQPAAIVFTFHPGRLACGSSVLQPVILSGTTYSVYLQLRIKIKLGLT